MTAAGGRGGYCSTRNRKALGTNYLRLFSSMDSHRMSDKRGEGWHQAGAGVGGFLSRLQAAGRCPA